jgi:t-SNARE complex subunit (syntaxin)
MTIRLSDIQETVIGESKEEDEIESQGEVESQSNASGPETLQTSKDDASEKRREKCRRRVYCLLFLVVVRVVVLKVAFGVSSD